MTAPWQDPCSKPARLDWGALWNSDWNLTAGASSWGDWTLGGDTIFESNDIYSAVIMCIFTDRRAPDDLTLPGDVDDRRGWFGDFVDIRGDRGETEMGSLLWLYERSAITDETLRNMRDAVYDSLQPLEDQGLIVERQVDIANRGNGRVEIMVNLYAENRQRAFSARFSRAWADVYPGLEIGAG